MTYGLCLIQQMELIFSLCRFSSGVIAVVLREENVLTLEMYTMYKIERIKSYLDINTSVLVICADKLYFEVARILQQNYVQYN